MIILKLYHSRELIKLEDISYSEYQDYLAMGCGLSKQKTPQQIAEDFRRENDRISVQIQTLISRAYIAGYLRDFEYNGALGFYFGVKTRHKLQPNQAFINTLAHLHDDLIATINERHLFLDFNDVDPAAALSVSPNPLPTAPPDADGSSSIEGYFSKVERPEKTSPAQELLGGAAGCGLYPPLHALRS